MRRGKLIGFADAFVNILAETMDDLSGGFRKRKRGRKSKAEANFYAKNDEDPLAPPVKLPKSIAFNREPFRHGEWRKLPFKPRPYIRLEEYDIVEELFEEQLENKLCTTKHGGCDGSHCTERSRLGEFSLEKDGFLTQCSCLASNTECDSFCSCGENNCLNRAVSQRKAVRLGVDVEEINSWGMDCYTRKNIQDGEPLVHLCLDTDT